jgi:hypothetical protein
VFRHDVASSITSIHFRAHRALLTPFALLIAFTITPVGCGPAAPKTAHLAGTITVAGQAPPADARVRLSIAPTVERPGAGSHVTGNKYDCPNSPLGHIAVDGPAATTPSNFTTDPADQYISLIDPIYSAGLELDVTGDNLKQDFDLKPFKPL